MTSKIYSLIISFLLVIIGFNQKVQGQVLDFTVGMDSALAGSIVEIPITVANFNSIQGYQGTLRFDTAIVDFVSLTSPTAGINNIFGSPGMGLIPLDAATFTWVDFSGGGKTFPNGTEVMKLTLQIKNGATPGTYPVTMNSSVTLLGYSIGSGIITPTVTQGSLTVNGCVPTADPGFLFSSSACQNAFNPQAVITGDLGGTFSVDQGASINAVTGVLDLGTTTGGTTYTITYTVGASCPATSTQTIQVLGLDDASFLFPDTVCINGFNPAAIITGLSGGTFSVDNSASINSNSGVLDLSSTIAGNTYDITYQTQGNCPAMSTISVYVRAVDDASFTIADTVCILDGNPAASITGLTGGFFSADNGAVIDPSTGVLDLTSTMSNTAYSITYQTQGDCPETSTQSIFVADSTDPSFTFPDTVCINGANPIPLVTGTQGGVFAQLFGPSFTVNAVTGEVDLASLSTGQTYTLSYDISGFCSSFQDHTFYVSDTLDASFLYPTDLCPGGPNPVAIITGDLGGIFSVSPTATINSTTGELDLTTAVVGTIYTITYSLNDSCQSSSQEQIIVEDLIAPDSASLPTITEECSATVSPPLTIDNCAGFITGTTTDSLSYSTPGTYSVSWTFDDGNGNQTIQTQTVIVQDTTPPVVICRNISVELDSTGKAVITAAQLDSMSSDNCGIMMIEVSQDTFTGNDIGVNAVMLTVTDHGGNSNTCMAEVTVNYTTSIKDLNAPNLSLNAFPNPVDEVLQLEWNSPWYGEVSINIVNTTGQTVKSETRSKNVNVLEGNISLGNLAEGIYILQVSQNGYSQYQRVLKK